MGDTILRYTKKCKTCKFIRASQGSNKYPKLIHAPHKPLPLPKAVICVLPAKPQNLVYVYNMYNKTVQIPAFNHGYEDNLDYRAIYRQIKHKGVEQRVIMECGDAIFDATTSIFFVAGIESPTLYYNECLVSRADVKIGKMTKRFEI